jgi:hypothetical protein
MGCVLVAVTLKLVLLPEQISLLEGGVVITGGLTTVTTMQSDTTEAAQELVTRTL